MSSCPACGESNPAGSAFCGECGRRLPTGEPVTAPPGDGSPYRTIRVGTLLAVAAAVLVVLVAVVVLLAVLGEDDGDSPAAPGFPTAGAERTTTTEAAFATTAASTRELEDEIVAVLTADQSPGNPTADAVVARCMAGRLIGEFGTDRTRELWDAADDPTDLADFGAGMTTAEGETFAAAAVDCIDLEAFATEMFAGQGLPDDVAVCAVENLQESGVLESLLRGSALAAVSGEEYDPTGDPELFGRLMEALNPCLTGG